MMHPSALHACIPWNACCYSLATSRELNYPIKAFCFFPGRMKSGPLENEEFNFSASPHRLNSSIIVKLRNPRPVNDAVVRVPRVLPWMPVANMRSAQPHSRRLLDR